MVEKCRNREQKSGIHEPRASINIGLKVIHDGKGIERTSRK
ncbi:MAG: hypothetical protein QXS46_04160 [Candidatus Bathyarchaeia archaeon]